MLGFIADILTSVTSILFPIFCSYKALRTSDPAVLTPWLMYWTTLSIFLLVETHLYFILYWVPFYSWIRLGVHLYLVLPGQQGCVYIYKKHIHPFLEEHERQIDRMISDGHEKAKAAGMDAVKNAIEYVRVQILGQQPKQPSPGPSRNVSYSTHLFNRFAMPYAREGLASAGPSDLLSALGKAMNQTTYPDAERSRAAQVDDLAASSAVVPPNLEGDERNDFINSQRERLQSLLRSFDAEAATTSAAPRGSTPCAQRPSSRKSYLAPPHDGDYMHKSRSESEFEDLAYETMPDPEQYRPAPPSPRPSSQQRASRGSGGGWGNFIWGNYGERDSVPDSRKRD